MGLDLTFAAGEGPVITNPVRGAADVARLAPVDVRDALAPVLETVRLVRGQLDPATPLIGFAGAPFTVACYCIEGGSSRHFVTAKRLMYEAPAAWHELLRRLVTVLGDYCAAQVEAGAQALQLFDSWVGALSPDDYNCYALPYSRQLFDRLRTLEVPLIHFGVGTGSLLELMRDAGGDVIGVDWRVPLDEARERIGPSHAVQGNLDPVALFAPLPELETKVRDVLRRAGGGTGHIFNLGHGVLPETPVDHVRAVVDLVHELSAR
jgi:uroporphyrinogen decarboxylase